MLTSLFKDNVLPNSNPVEGVVLIIDVSENTLLYCQVAHLLSPALVVHNNSLGTRAVDIVLSVSSIEVANCDVSAKIGTSVPATNGVHPVIVVLIIILLADTEAIL